MSSCLCEDPGAQFVGVAEVKVLTNDEAIPETRASEDVPDASRSPATREHTFCSFAFCWPSKPAVRKLQSSTKLRDSSSDSPSSLTEATGSTMQPCSHRRNSKREAKTVGCHSFLKIPLVLPSRQFSARSRKTSLEMTSSSGAPAKGPHKTDLVQDLKPGGMVVSPNDTTAYGSSDAAPVSSELRSPATRTAAIDIVEFRSPEKSVATGDFLTPEQGSLADETTVPETPMDVEPLQEEIRLQPEPPVVDSYPQAVTFREAGGMLSTSSVESLTTMLQAKSSSGEIDRSTTRQSSAGPDARSLAGSANGKNRTTAIETEGPCKAPSATEKLECMPSEGGLGNLLVHQAANPPDDSKAAMRRLEHLVPSIDSLMNRKEELEALASKMLHLVSKERIIAANRIFQQLLATVHSSLQEAGVEVHISLNLPAEAKEDFSGIGSHLSTVVEDQVKRRMSLPHLGAKTVFGTFKRLWSENLGLTGVCGASLAGGATPVANAPSKRRRRYFFRRHPSYNQNINAVVGSHSMTAPYTSIDATPGGAISSVPRPSVDGFSQAPLMTFRGTRFCADGTFPQSKAALTEPRQNSRRKNAAEEASKTLAEISDAIPLNQRFFQFGDMPIIGYGLPESKCNAAAPGVADTPRIRGASKLLRHRSSTVAAANVAPFSEKKPLTLPVFIELTFALKDISFHYELLSLLWGRHFLSSLNIPLATAASGHTVADGSTPSAARNPASLSFAGASHFPAEELCADMSRRAAPWIWLGELLEGLVNDAHIHRMRFVNEMTVLSHKILAGALSVDKSWGIVKTPTYEGCWKMWDTSAVAFLLDGNLDATMRDVLCLLYEGDLHKLWIPFLAESCSLQKVSDYGQVITHYSSLPWPLHDRETMLLGFGVDALDEPDYECILLSGCSVPSDGAGLWGLPIPGPAPGVTRMELDHFTMCLRPVKNDATKVRMQLFMYITTNLIVPPRALQNFIGRTGSSKLFGAIKKLCDNMMGSKHEALQQKHAEFYSRLDRRLHEFYRFD